MIDPQTYGATFDGVTDDTAAWQAALAAAARGELVDHPGAWVSLVSGNLTVPAGVRLGSPRGPFDPQDGSVWGPTFRMVQNAAPFVSLNTGSGLGDFIFRSVNQVPSTSPNPVPFGAVIHTLPGSAGCRIGSPYMPNAWIGLSLSGGRHLVDAPQIGAIARGVVIDDSLDTISIRKIQCSPYWRISEGQPYGPTAGSLDAFALSQAWALEIARADAVKIGEVSIFGLYGGVLANASALGSGYGMIGMLDADYISIGILGLSTNTPGLHVAQAMIGANASGVGAPGQYGVRTQGGSVVVKAWSVRGSFVGGNASNGAGTLIVPATNPG